MSLKAKQSKMAPPMTEGGDKPVKKKANKSKPHATNWGGYVLKLLKQVHPTMKISKQAMAVMVSCVEDTFERISAEAGNLHRRGDSKTLTTRVSESFQPHSNLVMLRNWHSNRPLSVGVAPWLWDAKNLAIDVLATHPVGRSVAAASARSGAIGLGSRRGLAAARLHHRSEWSPLVPG